MFIYHASLKLKLNHSQFHYNKKQLVNLIGLGMGTETRYLIGLGAKL